MNDVRWFLDRELGGQAGLAAEKKLLHSIKESEFLVLPPGRDSSASSFESETLGESCVFTLEWSRDGRFLAGSTSDNDIRLWDMHGGPSVQGTRFPVKTIAAAHKEIVTCIEWMNKMASEEEAFFSASIDKSIKMWRNSEEVCTLTHHQGKPFECRHRNV